MLPPVPTRQGRTPAPENARTRSPLNSQWASPRSSSGSTDPKTPAASGWRRKVVTTPVSQSGATTSSSSTNATMGARAAPRPRLRATEWAVRSERISRTRGSRAGGSPGPCQMTMISASVPLRVAEAAIERTARSSGAPPIEHTTTLASGWVLGRPSASPGGFLASSASVT